MIKTKVTTIILIAVILTVMMVNITIKYLTGSIFLSEKARWIQK